MPDSARTVVYNARTFLINGEPEIFLSACIHYFRVPRELWADRIAKAKRGGMNTIETYVAWNFHEPGPGEYQWDGDHDFEAFLTECERQGMYVIARPGPYICAEWDFGGFPAWLINVPGIATRTMNAPYLAAVDRWFDELIPIIAKHQWTRGGNVILVQVENEYANLQWTRGKEMVVDDDYQHYIRDGLLRRGIDVPLLSCAGYCSGTVEGVNSHNPGDLMPAHRERFPDAPLFSTEFWTGWYDLWGGKHNTRSAADTEYASLRCFAEGACGYNYYVYHGGTNFGYTPMYLQTTSYDYDAPISETGRLTEKWRACRRVALWAQTFKEILLTGEHYRELPATNGLRVTELRTKQRGSLLFVDNPDKENTVTGSVFPYLPEVALGPREILPWAHDVPIGASSSYLGAYAGLVKSDARLLTMHVRPDPYPGVRVYVYGEPSERKEVVLFNEGRGESVTVTFADAPQLYRVGPSQIVALSTELAGRVWFADDVNAPVLLGGDNVREHTTDFAVVELPPGNSHTLYALMPDGTLTPLVIETAALTAPPKLDAWETFTGPDYAAPDYDDSDWQEIEEPTSMIALGNGSNPYGWYRAHLYNEDGGDGELHFAACSDRLTLWVNGEKIGSSAVPPEDRRQDWTATFSIRLKPGANVLCVLADNLGLIKGDWQIGKGQEQEKKGIYGPVTLTLSGNCYLMDISRWRFRGMGATSPPPPPSPAEQARGELRSAEVNLSRETVRNSAPTPISSERNSPLACSAGEGGGGGEVTYHRTTFQLEALPDTATPLLIRLDGMGKGVLWLNGYNLGRYWQIGPQRDYYAPEPWLRVGENEIVLWETEGPEYIPDNVTLVWEANAAATVRVNFPTSAAVPAQ
jgi:hypothetical protein